MLRFFFLETYSFFKLTQAYISLITTRFSSDAGPIKSNFNFVSTEVEKTGQKMLPIVVPYSFSLLFLTIKGSCALGHNKMVIWIIRPLCLLRANCHKSFFPFHQNKWPPLVSSKQMNLRIWTYVAGNNSMFNF